ncbi:MULTISPECIES: 4Fe-4S domain-containing protein [unclassified Crossiella]|uniref:4Fe-4S domain-containing protein n=1 Tax=unclassified Crossiella TaxID=2620835 RepID=UPI001FFFB2C9|nr:MULTISPECIES: ferredoxin [unclassified Crossiella]MCK2243078.1 ferredoxin [Crossiella sp. S99.2]MCK2256955.1 ferredoxin [Crossiella sp. S99.1]
MLSQLADIPELGVILAQNSSHDAGVRQVAALSARLAYAMMCFTLVWGVLTATGWVRRTTSRQALRSGHMMLAVMTIAFGSLHGFAFIFVTDVDFGVVKIMVPFAEGGFARHAAGIIGLQLMTAVAISVAVRRWLVYRHWLRFHQLGYLAVGLTVVHAWLGAAANGNLALLQTAGITLVVPVITLTALRFLPPRLLTKVGLVSAEPAVQPVQQDPAAPPNPRAGKVGVSVDNERCQRYGICETAAPEVFQLVEDGRLRYDTSPHAQFATQAKAAARCCPMRAITVQERGVK